MNDKPYSSLAYGTLELTGSWTQTERDLLKPVLEGMGYYWDYLSLAAPLSLEGPTGFFGGSEIPLGMFLFEELYEMTEDDMRRTAPDSFSIKDGAISALANAMQKNGLEIELKFTVKNVGEAEYHEVYRVAAEYIEMMEGVCLCAKDVFSDRPPYQPGDTPFDLTPFPHPESNPD